MTELDLTTAVNEIGELRVEPGSSPRFFFLIGAGISAPTIPLATEITEQCRVFAEKKGRGGQLGNPSSPLEMYSYWFERAYPQPAQRQEYLRGLISDRPISHANLRLAHLLLDPTIAQLVVTPNFDDQLSRALTLFGKPMLFVTIHELLTGSILSAPPFKFFTFTETTGSTIAVTCEAK